MFMSVRNFAVMNRRSGRPANPWWRPRPRAKGFRIPCSCAHKLHVRRLRVRVPCWVRILERMKKVCDRLLMPAASVGKRTLNAFSAKKSSCGVCPSAPAGPSYIAGSNSFYADAIADCLEFIKRSYSPMDSRPGDAL